MQDVLGRFRGIAEDPYGWLKDWKRANKKKIIGYSPMYFPEEFVHAAGMLPVLISGSDEPITQAGTRLPSFCCAWLRGSLDAALKGKLDVLDGVAFAEVCCEIRQAFDVWRMAHLFRYLDAIWLPPVLNHQTFRDYLTKELERIRLTLQQFARREITDEALRNSILIYNRNRALMRELYDHRRNNPRLLTARDILNVVMSGMVMPKEEHSALLTELLAKARAEKPSPDGRVRLILSGSICENPHSRLLDVIEEAGGVILDDDLFTGRRYFATDVPVDADPMEAYVKYYVNRPPCVTTYDPGKERADYLIKMVNDAKAQGVVHLQWRYCEYQGFEYPYLKKRFSEAGIPLLMLEIDHELEGVGQIKTRLEAFTEMIKGGA